MFVWDLNRDLNVVMFNMDMSTFIASAHICRGETVLYHCSLLSPYMNFPNNIGATNLRHATSVATHMTQFFS